MSEPVQDHPVVVVMIIGDRVTVDGKNVGHDGTLPLSWVAIDAVVTRVAAPLGRPVHAVVTDASGTSTLVIHLDGGLSDVQQVGSEQSTHFPAPRRAEPSSAPAVPMPAPVSRLRLLGAAAVITLIVGLLGAATLNSVSTPPAQSVDSPHSPSAAAPTQDPSPVSSGLATTPSDPAPPKITGIARHSRGGPVRLTIRSSMAPLKVRVVLVPVGGQPGDEVVRVIRLREAGVPGRTVVVFDGLSAATYQWRISAAGAQAKTGTIEVQAAPPAVTPEPESPVVLPRSEPEPAAPRPPNGPRDNNPIPPTPQP